MVYQTWEFIIVVCHEIFLQQWCLTIMYIIHTVPTVFCFVVVRYWPMLFISFNPLRPRQMAAIFQTTFSNAFSWMKMYEFRLRFHWILFPRVQLTISQHWFRSWLGTSQVTSHDLNQWWLVYWRINVSLGLNELSFLWSCFIGCSVDSNLLIASWLLPLMM